MSKGEELLASVAGSWRLRHHEPAHAMSAHCDLARGRCAPLEPPAARLPQSALLRQAGIKLAFELLVLKAGAVGRGRSRRHRVDQARSTLVYLDNGGGLACAGSRLISSFNSLPGLK